MFTRKVLPKVKATVQLIKKGDEDIFVLQTSRKFFSQTLEFEPGEEFMERILNGDKVTSVVTFQNNTMTHTQQHAEKPLTIVRNFFDDEMVEIIKYGDIACTSWYASVR